jgi:hypothetical protein
MPSVNLATKVHFGEVVGEIYERVEVMQENLGRLVDATNKIVVVINNQHNLMNKIADSLDQLCVALMRSAPPHKPTKLEVVKKPEADEPA